MGVQHEPLEDRRLSHWLLEEFYNNQREGICIHELVLDDAGVPTDYVILAANPAYETILGIPVADAIGRRASDLYGAGVAPYLTEYAETVRTGATTGFETFFPPMRQHFDILVVPLKERRFATLFSDITDRKQAEQKLFKTSQALRTLSAGNQLLVRVSDEKQLLQGMCQILASTGGYRFAWVARVADSAPRRAVPVTHAGHEEGFLEEIDLSDWTPGRLPELDCIEEQRPIIVNNTLSHAQYPARREAAVSRGYASSATFPLMLRTGVWGVLSVYASEPDAFDVDQRAILSEMANDMSYGIASLQSKTQLEESENLHRAVFETARAAIALIEEDETIALVNPAFESLSGYSREEIEGKRSWTEFVPAEDLERIIARHKRGEGYCDESPSKDSFRVITRAGEYREVLLSFERIPGTTRAVASLLDITERKQSADALRHAMESVIKVLGFTVASRDPYTAGHQERVADLVVSIAKELSLPEDSVQALRHAGIIHDIGKISVPAEILSKPVALTPIEYELLKEHPAVAYDILKDITLPWPVAEIILQHHERMDGSGYPQGLKGDQIRLEARILAVADVVEAMASHRPYRPALGTQAALQEIQTNAGSLYDPAVVEACLRVFASGYELTSAE